MIMLVMNRAKDADSDDDTDNYVDHKDDDHEPDDHEDDNDDGGDHLGPSSQESHCKSFAKSLSRARDDRQLALYQADHHDSLVVEIMWHLKLPLNMEKTSPNPLIQALL